MSTRSPNSPAAGGSGAIPSTERPHRGPVAVLTRPEDMRDLVRDLRAAAAQHADTIWVHARPVARGQRLSIAPLGQDLLDAMGVVSLTPPRRYGENHLLRPLTHLIHGPVRHIVIDDVAQLKLPFLDELQQTALISNTQLWLLLDTADSPIAATAGRPDARARAVADLLAWVNASCVVYSAAAVLTAWTNRHDTTPGCVPLPRAWWTTPLEADAALPTPCGHHAYPDPNTLPDQLPDRLEASGLTGCVLCWARRALTAGDISPGMLRARLVELADHPETTVEDRWEMTYASRDLYTPGVDALHHVGADIRRVHLADISPDAAVVRTTSRGLRHDLKVPTHMRTPLARLHTSRRLAGCLPHERLEGVFDSTTGIPHKR